MNSGIEGGRGDFYPEKYFFLPQIFTVFLPRRIEGHEGGKLGILWN
jgi:hypothetical protein